MTHRTSPCPTVGGSPIGLRRGNAAATPRASEIRSLARRICSIRAERRRLVLTRYSPEKREEPRLKWLYTVGSHAAASSRRYDRRRGPRERFLERLSLREPTCPPGISHTTLHHLPSNAQTALTPPTLVWSPAPGFPVSPFQLLQSCVGHTTPQPRQGTELSATSYRHLSHYHLTFTNVTSATNTSTMELDDLDDLLGPRQMRNCLPCKQRKIKCEHPGIR